MSREKWLTYDEYKDRAKADLSAYIDKKMKEGFGKYCKLCGTDLPHPSLFDDKPFWKLDEKMTYCKYCSNEIYQIKYGLFVRAWH